MPMIWIEIKNADEVIGRFDRFNLKVAERVRDIVSEISLAVQKSAKILCPVDTNRLRGSIHILFSKDGFGSEIGTNVIYAAVVEFGSMPHWIKARTAKALRWVKGGTVYFAKKVWHPGTKPQPFLFPAAEMHRQRYIDEMSKVLKYGIDEATK